MDRKKIVIAGGSGFLGRTLAHWYGDRGADVTILTRGGTALHPARAVRWNGETVGEWVRRLEGADALINLAGRSVNCRYTRANRRRIMDSRVRSTRVLGVAVNQCKKPPAVWLNAGTATIYKHTYGEPHGEDGEIGASPEAKDAFSIEVAKAWEGEFGQASTPNTRKTVLRAAMVFGREPGGVFEVLRRLTSMGLGGRMGHGRQYVSWIHAEDFCRAVDWLIERPDAAGAYNLAAPHPVTNADMMALFRQSLGAPIGLPATRWMLEIGAFIMRTETELILKSRRVVPARLLNEGFAFNHPRMEDALAELVHGIR